MDDVSSVADTHSQTRIGSIELIDANDLLIEIPSLDHEDFNEEFGGSSDLAPNFQSMVGTEDVVNNDGGTVDVGDDEEGCNIFGKIFTSPEDAYYFYNQYALKKGFGIRKDWVGKSRKTGNVIRRNFVCNKQGMKNLKGKNNCDEEIKRRRDTRTQCQSYISISLMDNGQWIVDKFNDEHNHSLTTPSKVFKHRSHNKLHRSTSCKQLISELNETGLRPCHIAQAVNAITGDVYGDITQRQCVAYLSNERRKFCGKGCCEIIKHFQQKCNIDSVFYFAMDLAQDGSLKNVFWVDGRSRDAYSHFYDVVVFDVTYKTNKFKMPFAPFVGVNHHRQSILFGAALLDDETEATFVWLFEQFLKCMFDIPPLAIITDQDGAIRNAIKKVFPNVRHRLCSWHINKHVMERLQPLRSCYNDFNVTYLEWIKSDTIEQFEAKWKELKVRCGIEDNSWLGNMYNLRQHWIKAYLKDTFFAGMTTSGRSESINSFFDGYVNSNTTLNNFVVQYDRAVQARRNVENDEDFKTLNTRPTLSSNHPIEEQAGKCYTRVLFEEFKKEWIESIDCVHQTLNIQDNVVKYKVGKHNVDNSKWRVVYFDTSVDMVAKCSCAKFEMEGIFCKHILFIMRRESITKIPDRYILPRWTMNARFINHPHTVPSADDRITPFTMWRLRSKFEKLLEHAKSNCSRVQRIEGSLDSLLNEFIQMSISTEARSHEFVSQTIPTEGTSYMDMMPQIRVRDPVAPVKTKGRPKVASRLKAGLEIAKEETKRRTCGYCGQKGHYRTACQIRKMTEELAEDDTNG